MGKSTISMAIFNSYVKLPEGTLHMAIQMGMKMMNRKYWDTLQTAISRKSAW